MQTMSFLKTASFLLFSIRMLTIRRCYSFSKKPKQSLSLISKVISKPDLSKVNGEDAHFTSPLDIGCFDGVGAWRSMGIDAGLFSSKLSEFVFDYISGARNNKDSEINLIDSLNFAMNKVKSQEIKGSSTACLASLNPASNVITIANIGDSGALILRPRLALSLKQNFDILFQSPPMCHRFNTPFQLGYFREIDPKNSSIDIEHEFDQPSEAACTYHAVQEDDIILLATDGLFDNLHLHEITDCIVSKLNKASLSINYANQDNLCRAISNRRQAVEELLTDAVTELGALAFEKSLEQDRVSPFTLSAIQERQRQLRLTGLGSLVDTGADVYQDELGGKPDDITIILSVVGPSPVL